MFEKKSRLEIECPNCHAVAGQMRNGQNRSGTQRTKCRNCNYVYTSAKRRKGYPPFYIFAALVIYVYNPRYRVAARLCNIHPQTMINWVRKYIKTGFYLSVTDIKQLADHKIVKRPELLLNLPKTPGVYYFRVNAQIDKAKKSSIDAAKGLGPGVL